MIKYLIRRIIMLIPVMIGVSLVTFSLIYIVPGDAVEVIVGERASEEIREKAIEELGLNKPFHQQYLSYMSNVLKGNLGKSYINNKSIKESIMERFPITFKLTLYSFAISVIVGIFVGVVSAVKQNTVIDSIVRGTTLLGVSTPVMFSSLLIIYIFGVWLKVMPVSGIGDGSIKYFLLPSLVLGLNSAVFTARLTRSCMLEVIRQDYIRTARSKGIAEKIVIFKHAMRNAMIPISTNLIMSFGYLLTGSVITETIFGLPGLGSETVRAVFQRDIPAVMGYFLFQAVIFVTFNLLVDISYALINPRIRFN
ncbi:ABC transporter permease [Paramaledivibacter caminithermalis]|uniref:Peptide/nickel transport system permease protein n=1 Tax=Paramaledivibacter caminithermalis (strain DSM 15212 / CIP 107654 / DViRD3) TaxID=1121301 RepID=A0A1M6PV45_PARC5|nr:ABC transporter permease [Paramaledivibacter caminithermalis]SHK11844.1 peptide/nickel transport system permease protein [Paramaledivibacter caminithermalis DSM 15212]